MELTSEQMPEILRNSRRRRMPTVSGAGYKSSLLSFVSAECAIWSQIRVVPRRTYVEKPFVSYKSCRRRRAFWYGKPRQFVM